MGRAHGDQALHAVSAAHIFDIDPGYEPSHAMGQNVDLAARQLWSVKQRL